MRVSDEPLINQARERFALQDYYGAIHLLERLPLTPNGKTDRRALAAMVGGPGA